MGRRLQLRCALNLKAVTAVLTPPLLLTGCGNSTPSSALGPAGTLRPGATIESDFGVLQATWEGYKRSFVTDAGRVADPSRGGDTTSEGQSYALLRAVWLDDRGTFDTIWTWTRDHLRTRGDALLSWLWHSDGRGGGQITDRHSASDADEDTALALLMAAGRWNDGTAAAEARRMIADIWAKEVAPLRGQPFLAAGDWAAAQLQPGPVINPSYLAPYAYRIFAGVDPEHEWSTLVTTSYDVLQKCAAAPLQETRSAGLPPNWCAVDRTNGAIASFPTIAGADDYGYDAFRVMWRVALDDRWFDSPRAHAFLSSMDFLRSQWHQRGHLAAVYSHEGSAIRRAEDLAVLGGDLAAFLGVDDDSARAIDSELRGAVVQESASRAHFRDAGDYYEQNWAWFGIALAAGALPDLAR
jgi:endo-1,4-beta-D-glucanase Y